MEVVDNKAALRRMIESVINDQDLAVADEFFSAEHVLHPIRLTLDQVPRE